MAFVDTTFKTVSRAALVALAIGATSLAAAPAQAQSFSSGFSLQIQGNGGDQGFSRSQRRDSHNGWDDRARMRCLTNREVVRGISAYGYGRVEIVQELRGDRVMVRATKSNWSYSMRVDKCSGQVDRMERIGRNSGRSDRGHPANGGGYNNGDGFSFQFNFGN